MTTMVDVLIVVAAGYACFVVFAWLYADEFIFRPGPSSYTSLPGLGRVPAADGTPLAVVHLPAPDAGFTLFYLHGNGEDLGDIAEHLADLHVHGYGVLAFDYRGYGLTPGRPSERRVHADAAAVFRHAVEALGVAPESLLLYGRSLGAGPAIALAAREPVGGLILEGAFTSAFRVVTVLPLLPGDRFRNLRLLPAVRCPTLVLHATEDRTVPFRHGRALWAAAPEPKRRLWVEGAGHNDLVAAAGERYWDALAELGRLARR